MSDQKPAHLIKRIEERKKKKEEAAARRKAKGDKNPNPRARNFAKKPKKAEPTSSPNPRSIVNRRNKPKATAKTTTTATAATKATAPAKATNAAKPKQAAAYAPRSASTRERFNDKFKKHKAKGDATFEFEGKMYNTKTKDEVEAKKAADKKAATPKKKTLRSKLKSVLGKLKIKPASGKRKYDPRKKRFVTVKK